MTLPTAKQEPITLLSGVTLTGAYSGNVSATQVSNSENQLTLFVSYTMDAGETSNSIEVKVEFSPDGTTWFQETSKSISSGTMTHSLAEHTFASTGAGNEDNFVVNTNANYQYFRVSAKETGIASTGGVATIKSVISFI